MVIVSNYGASWLAVKMFEPEGNSVCLRGFLLLDRVLHHRYIKF